MEVSKAKINFIMASSRNGSASDSRSEGCVSDIMKNGILNVQSLAT